MFDLADTIVAPATGLGESAIAIVRLSGPRAVQIVDSFVALRSGRSLESVKARRLLACVVLSGDEIVDHALCVRFTASASYTGEEMVELHLHGNPLIVDIVLRRAVEGGARLASAGEFSRRAFVHGKLDLTEIEGLGASIRAESERALYLSQRQLHGELASVFGRFRSDVVRLLGLLELELDFAVDGYSLAARDEICGVVDSMVIATEQLLASYRSGERLRRGPRVLLLGRPNAGKSSLFNALLGFSRALVSPVAGTTRDYVEERISHNGVVIHLVDTAGLRETDDSIESAGVRLSVGLVGVVDRVLYLVDSSESKIDADDTVLSSVVRDSGVLFTRVLTKSDIGVVPQEAVSCSVFNRSSIDALLDLVIAEYSTDITSSLTLLSRRQFDLVSTLRERLLGCEWRREDPELLSYDLRSVLGPLDSLSGAVSSEEVLNEIFAAFCIGK